MKFNYPIIFSLCFILVISSCSTTYNELTQMELDEWQIYTPNQQLIFSSQFGQKDTHEVVAVFGAWDEDGDTYNEITTSSILKLSDQIIENRSGFLKLQKDGDALITSIKWPHHNNTLVLTGTPTLPIFPYKGDTLFDVWRSAVSPLFIDSTSAYIDTVYYSKQFGFIKYTDIYNNEFTKLN